MKCPMARSERFLFTKIGNCGAVEKVFFKEGVLDNLPLP
jgi:hypothetical protein